jgi:uncharacterized SAM-binding protein YcdF (DUF218 family)
VKKLNLSRQLARKRYVRIFQKMAIVILSLIFAFLAFNFLVRVPINALKPVDAIFVLGGSVHREVHAAQLAKKYPNVPVLISHGSDDPCILATFRQERARLSDVWLETCSDSTFDNFLFGVPILDRWKAHKVILVSSGSHLKRATWMAKILLGARGIALVVDPAQEKGVAGNQESNLKTSLDLARSAIWAFFSQFLKPSCRNFSELKNLDLKSWQQKTYRCESYQPENNR